MTRDIMSLFSQAKDWGMKLFAAPSTVRQGSTLEVYQRTPTGTLLVGRLSCENDEYVFRYDTDYTGKPISAFPNSNQEYRSKYLWPFFAIRIPPLDREDMREEIATRSLDDGQILEILGSVAKVSVTNPYEFRLS